MSATHTDTSLQELRSLQARHADLAEQIQQLIDRLSTSPATSLLLLPEASIELQPGEVYAGLVLGDQPGYHLVLMAPKPEGRLSWADAKAWAERVGGRLPNRQEQALLYANAKPHFEETWYWSGQEHEENASYAWFCDFGDGLQSDAHKSYEGLARAVRSIPL